MTNKKNNFQNLDRFKFRVWAKDVISYSNNIRRQGTMIYYKDDPQRFITYIEFYSGKEKAKTSDVVLMQSTGLRDKNGTLIYEGDVVIDEEAIKDLGTCYTEVKWEDGLYMIYDSFYIGKEETKELTVVGNIYENKELLNI